MANNDIDPSIEAMLNDVEQPEANPDDPFDSQFAQIQDMGLSMMGSAQKKEFASYVEEKKSTLPKMLGCVPEVDLNIKQFAPITKFFEETPSKIYDDPTYKVYRPELYAPSPEEFNNTKEFEKGLELYSRGVLITNKCADLLPDYFSFVKGIVDSEDVSLNILSIKTYLYSRV